LRLLNFNVEAQCTPSRAALMTGRYAIRTGNGSVPIDTPRYGLVQWEVTIAEMLSDLGYSTACFGKWHIGHTEGRFPTDQGFDEWFGIPNSSDEAYWPNRSMYQPNSDPYAGPEYVMEGVKGQIPKKLKAYDLAYRRVIDRHNRVRRLVDLPLSEMTGKLQASVDQTQQYFDVHLGFLLGDMV
jgi:arylsulfatase